MASSGRVLSIAALLSPDPLPTHSEYANYAGHWFCTGALDIYAVILCSRESENKVSFKMTVLNV